MYTQKGILTGIDGPVIDYIDVCTAVWTNHILQRCKDVHTALGRSATVYIDVPPAIDKRSTEITQSYILYYMKEKFIKDIYSIYYTERLISFNKFHIVLIIFRYGKTANLSVDKDTLKLYGKIYFTLLYAEEKF